MIIRKCLKNPFIYLHLTFSYTNHYDTLGVEHGASQEEIKRKYYELAKKYHPDSQNNTQNAQKFVKINQAYETLGDQIKRRNYDNRFSSNQHYHYDNTQYNTYYEAGSRRQKRYQEQTQRMYNEPFINLVRKSYFSIFLWVCYAYMAFNVFGYCIDKLKQRQRQQRQMILDNTPGVLARRRQHYEKMMKQKNIYALPCDLKYRTLEKQSTKSAQKRKNSLQTIKGVSKIPVEQVQPDSKQTYM